MSDTVKLIIEIPKAQKKMVDAIMELPPQVENDLVSAIRHGTPLDDVKAEIEEMRIKFMEHGGVYEHSAYGLDYAIALLNDIGKSESEDTDGKKA